MIRLFRVFIPKSVVALVVSDFLLVAGCFLLTLVLVKGDETEIWLLYENGALSVAAAVLTVMAGLYFQNLYAEFRIRARMLLVQQVLLALGLVFVVQAMLAYINAELVLPRSATLAASLLLLVVLPLWRWAYSSVIYKGLGIERVLFLGTDAIGVDVARQIAEKPELGLQCIGFVDDNLPAGSELAGFPVVGRAQDLAPITAELKPDRIIISLAEQRQALPVHTLLDLRFSASVRIEEGATAYESAFGRVAVRRLRPSQLIFSTELGPRPWSMRLQTMYSFVIALIGLVPALPIMAIVALLVRLTSPGPILFRQRRVGLQGAPFTLYKFRSMVVDAEAKTGAVWATRSDPRVTPIGRILRKTRLDELPQLFNVLRGDMSVVGPRPERPEFVATLSQQIPFYRQRHCVKPGVTGWAQINYKYGETLEDTIVKLEYDLYYIKNLSPSLDAFIMFHTFKVMLFSQHGQ